MTKPVENEHDTLPPSMDPATGAGTQAPPTTFFGILRQLGPGLIIAGSIVGSGELIATTKTGAQAGISLLWLIIIGCLIKVFVQVELGRFTITHGETTLSALDQVPGPRLKVNWIVWYWLIMMLVSLGQLGGIVGGVGQALAISFPITGDYAAATSLPSQKDLRKYIATATELEAGTIAWEDLDDRRKNQYSKIASRLNDPEPEVEPILVEKRKLEQARVIKAVETVNLLIDAEAAALETPGPETEAIVKEREADVKNLLSPNAFDDVFWAVGVTLFTIALLYRGSYGLIQNISTAMVVGFTFITIGNVISLQNTQQWHVSMDEILRGLAFRFPEGSGISTALATFGIIGVGANELISYPYWCLEKGYAKFTGSREESPEWAARAKGWLMVMHWDAWASMVIYTIATLAFFLMGVAVLYRDGGDPEGMRMVSTLATAYVPVFGEYARWLFLVGAIAVLYSTFLVANAGHARVFADSFKIFGLMDHHSQKKHDSAVSWLGVALPCVCLAIFATRADPVALVLLGGTMQAIMLPMLGFAALFFRYRMCDARLQPGPIWDALLAISCLGMLVAGGWNAYDAGSKILALLGIG